MRNRVLFVVSAVAAVFVPSSLAQNSKNGGPATLDSSQADFGMGVLRATADRSNHSLAIASVAVSASLAMCAAAAAGSTRTQIVDAIAKGFSLDEAQRHIQRLAEEQRNATNENRGKVRIANLLLTKQGEGAPFKSAFVDSTAPSYGALARTVDCDNVTTALVEADIWENEGTAEKIADAVEKHVCGADAHPFLLSTASVTADWEHSFKPDETFEKEFFMAEGLTKTVRMMPKWAFGIYRYAEDADMQMLGMPYKGSEMFLYIFLPRERFGLATVEKEITGRSLLGLIRSGEIADVEVEVPTFTTDTSIALSESLRPVGVVDAFGESADFPDISSSRLHLSELFHSTLFRVSESGTRLVQPSSVPPAQRMLWQGGHLKFVADHPFMFAVVTRTGVLVLIGHYA